MNNKPIHGRSSETYSHPIDIIIIVIITITIIKLSKVMVK
jgi:hypothetical protein